MQELRVVQIHDTEVPVLISDEKEALLAAKAAGRAMIGLWRLGQEMGDLSAADYVVEDPETIDDTFLERVARRHLRLPWKICETERLVIREMYADDFDEVWSQQIGRGFGTVEELQAYTDHQYRFYEFGFWAVVLKETGELIGVAGLTMPEKQSQYIEAERPKHDSDERPEIFWYSPQMSAAEQTGRCEDNRSEADPGDPEDADEVLELGYHIFFHYRGQGFAKEACRAILRYGVEELCISRFLVRIARDNFISKKLAADLGFR